MLPESFFEAINKNTIQLHSSKSRLSNFSNVEDKVSKYDCFMSQNSANMQEIAADCMVVNLTRDLWYKTTGFT